MAIGLGLNLGLGLAPSTGVSIFDLRVNGQPLFVNSQQMKATNDAD